MKILIIEGIATSGKSSLVKMISDSLGMDSVKIYNESKTHIPIMHKPDELHIEFFKSLINDAVKSDTNLAVFDRLHYTQAYRAKASIAEYSVVEILLASHDTFVVYLHVDENKIAERVRLATEHRDKKWGEYIQTKGRSLDEIADYYINQQRNLQKMLSHSKLISQVFNTTDHEYEAVTDKIINDWYS